MTYVTDLSHHQPRVDFRRMAADGCAAVILKATEGRTYTDPLFGAHTAGAAAAGIPWSAYHYARPDASAPAQQAARLAALGGRRGLVLDLEETGGLGRRQLTTWSLGFLDHLAQATGQLPMIYTGYYFARDQMVADPALARFPLWLARYTSSPTTYTPSPWASWSLWQFSSTAPTPGVGPCDRSRIREGFNMTAWIKGAAPTAPQTPADGTYTATAAGWPQLQRGSRGQAVKTLQGLLYARGLGHVVGPMDGIYGKGTEEAVRFVQGKAKLSPVSGVCGPRTLAWLLRPR